MTARRGAQGSRRPRLPWCQDPEQDATGASASSVVAVVRFVHRAGRSTRRHRIAGACGRAYVMRGERGRPGHRLPRLRSAIARVDLGGHPMVMEAACVSPGDVALLPCCRVSSPVRVLGRGCQPRAGRHVQGEGGSRHHGLGAHHAQLFVAITRFDYSPASPLSSSRPSSSWWWGRAPHQVLARVGVIVMVPSHRSVLRAPWPASTRRGWSRSSSSHSIYSPVAWSHTLYPVLVGLLGSWEGSSRRHRHGSHAPGQAPPV